MNRQATSSPIVATAASMLDPSAAFLVLEIRQGRTSFPRRPVCLDRFLIGGAAECHLRLGGAMPPLHSLVRREGADVRLEAIAASPPLRVNGQACESVLLRNGDLIQIGPFRIAVHCGAVPPPAAESADVGQVCNLPDRQAAVPEVAGLPHELSAAELVERIEAEEREVARFEAGRRLAARALLDAVLQTAADLRHAEETPRLRFREALEQAADRQTFVPADMVLPAVLDLEPRENHSPRAAA